MFKIRIGIFSKMIDCLTNKKEASLRKIAFVWCNPGCPMASVAFLDKRVRAQDKLDNRVGLLAPRHFVENFHL